MNYIKHTALSGLLIILMAACGADNVKESATNAGLDKKNETERPTNSKLLKEMIGKWRAVDVDFYEMDKTSDNEQMKAYIDFILNTIVYYREDGSMMVQFKNGMEEDGSWYVMGQGKTLVEKLNNSKNKDVSEIKLVNDSLLVLHSDLQKASMTFRREKQ